MGILLGSASSIEHAIDAVYGHVLDNGYTHSHTDPERTNRLRISSFPFCARAWWLNQPNSRNRTRRSTGIGQYFTSVGTAVHHVIQSCATTLAGPCKSPVEEDHEVHRLPGGALLVQSWKCKNCRASVEFGPRPKTCAYCKDDIFIGDETEVEFGKFTLGHMDGTIAFPHEKDAPYSKKWFHIPIDYKTSSKAVLESGKLPYPTNEDQLLSYGCILHRDGYNVPGTVLIYICRDNPNNRKVCFSPLDVKKQEQKMRGYEATYTAARKVRTVEGFMKLAQRTKDDFERSCDYCQFKPMCMKQTLGKGDDVIKAQAASVVKFLNGKRKWDYPKF